MGCECDKLRHSAIYLIFSLWPFCIIHRDTTHIQLRRFLISRFCQFLRGQTHGHTDSQNDRRKTIHALLCIAELTCIVALLVVPRQNHALKLTPDTTSTITTMYDWRIKRWAHCIAFNGTPIEINCGERFIESVDRLLTNAVGNHAVRCHLCRATFHIRLRVILFIC